MKNFNFNLLYTALLIFSFLLFSCNKDDDTSNSNNNNSKNIGVNKIAMDVSGSQTGHMSGNAFIEIHNSQGYNTFEIEGGDASEATFKINFYTYNGSSNPVPWPEKGTYPLDSGADIINGKGYKVDFEYIPEWRDYSKNVTGSLTITDNSNNQLKGTFEFSADENGDNGSITVTNGTFHAETKEE